MTETKRADAVVLRRRARCDDTERLPELVIVVRQPLLVDGVARAASASLGVGNGGRRIGGEDAKGGEGGDVSLHGADRQVGALGNLADEAGWVFHDESKNGEPCGVGAEHVNRTLRFGRERRCGVRRHNCSLFRSPLLDNN